MKYFKTNNDLLVQYNTETNVYKIRNTISKENHILSKEEFEALNPIQIKKDKFCQQMNIYFKNVKHEWIHEGVRFRKIDNFEKSDYNNCTNYIWKDIPKHHLKDKPYFGELILVYHWGRVYYFTFSYNGYPQGQLIDTKTFDLVQWAKPKHCAPIFNIDTKQIV